MLARLGAYYPRRGVSLMGLHLERLFQAMLAYIGQRLKSENYTINYYRKKVLQFRPQDIRKSLIISYSFLQYYCKMFYNIGFSFVTTFYRFFKWRGKNLLITSFNLSPHLISSSFPRQEYTMVEKKVQHH